MKTILQKILFLGILTSIVIGVEYFFYEPRFVEKPSSDVTYKITGLETNGTEVRVTGTSEPALSERRHRIKLDSKVFANPIMKTRFRVFMTPDAVPEVIQLN